MLEYASYALVLLALGAYVLLDGYDLGIGILSLFDRSDRRRKEYNELIATAWDANESWIILAGRGAVGGPARCLRHCAARRLPAARGHAAGHRAARRGHRAAERRPRLPARLGARLRALAPWWPAVPGSRGRSRPVRTAPSRWGVHRGHLRLAHALQRAVLPWGWRPSTCWPAPHGCRTRPWDRPRPGGPTGPTAASGGRGGRRGPGTRALRRRPAAASRFDQPLRAVLFGLRSWPPPWSAGRSPGTDSAADPTGVRSPPWPVWRPRACSRSWPATAPVVVPPDLTVHAAASPHGSQLFLLIGVGGACRSC